jgi:hypothetical protein
VNTIPVSDKPDYNQSETTSELTCGTVTHVLWKSAWEALVLTFVVSILATVGFGLASGIWREMMPSLPPGFAGKPTANGPHSETLGGLWSFFHQHGFALLFAALFIAKSAARFISYSRNEQHRDAAAWVRRVSQEIHSKWFGLLVWNAIIALVSAFVLQLTQMFSLIQLIVGFLMSLCAPFIHGFLRLLPGGGLFVWIEHLFGWYCENQIKFTFWILYGAAICDDLGLPNLKTLFRNLVSHGAKRLQAVNRNHTA